MQLGLVASLNRPGGNITGVTTVSAELEAKRLGFLRELVPSATSVAVLVNPTRPGVDTQLAQIQEAARVLGLPLHILKASSERDLDEVFATLSLVAGPARSRLPPTVCLRTAVIKSLRWRDAIRFPRCPNFANLPLPAA